MSYLARQVVKLHEADYFVLLESSSHAVLKNGCRDFEEQHVGLATTAFGAR